MKIIECEELSKCPCCGFKADYNHIDSLHKVSCSKCGIRTCGLSSKIQALKTWNRRPTDPKKKTKKREFKEALRSL